MPPFAPVDEQLTYLKKGSSEIIRESELREKLERLVSIPPRLICISVTLSCCVS